MPDTNVKPTPSTDRDHTTTIVVNGRRKFVTSKTISFEQVVALADGMPTGPDVTYTVTYHRGNGNRPEGTMTAGDIVRVKEGMVFNVTPTNKS